MSIGGLRSAAAFLIKNLIDDGTISADDNIRVIYRAESHELSIIHPSFESKFKVDLGIKEDMDGQRTAGEVLTVIGSLKPAE